MSFAHRATDAVAVLRYVLPFPPSVNRYYRNIGYRTLLSREGREYRTAVCSLLAGRVGQPLQGLLEVQLDLFPPDARRRDWDNFQKGIWDSLQHAGVYLDDSQVKRAVIEMHPPTRQSRAEVAIAPYIPVTEEEPPCPASFMHANSTTPTSIPMTTSSMSKRPSRSRRPREPKRSTPLTKRAT
ncbi:MAG: RusA family crossover junction endodeoxyribonuclease [Planctomycetaceae bacterium]|nr:RusA family crossover junction endodeoxyribonuclease [Planctomycetaceae bacterium]